MKNLFHLTSNQYYGGLNRRFDRRAKQLRRFGFKYVRVEEFAIAIFVKGRPDCAYAKKKNRLTACFVMNADNRAYAEALQRACRGG